MNDNRLQHLESIARQLTVMLEEAERQEAVEAVKECKWKLRQIENEIERIKKMHS